MLELDEDRRCGGDSVLMQFLDWVQAVTRHRCQPRGHPPHRTVDRLSRLNADDGEALKLSLAEKRIRSMLEKGMSGSDVWAATGASRVHAGPHHQANGRGLLASLSALQAPHQPPHWPPSGTRAARARLACPFLAMPVATIARGIGLD